MKLPIVTLPGTEMRGRQSAGMLELMEMHDLVATDAADYVDKAVRIACEPGYRAALAQRIEQGWPRIFDRVEPVAALADVLQGLHERRS